MLDKDKSNFENLTLLREGLALLLDEEPVAVDVLICGKKKLAGWMADLATYVALANGAPLPDRKQKDSPRPLEALHVWGTDAMPGAAYSLAEGNQLARILTVLPPNELTPAAYRVRIGELAGELGWDIEEFDLPRDPRLGIGSDLEDFRKAAKAARKALDEDELAEGEHHLGRSALVGLLSLIHISEPTRPY